MQKNIKIHLCIVYNAHIHTQHRISEEKRIKNGFMMFFHFAYQHNAFIASVLWCIKHRRILKCCTYLVQSTFMSSLFICCYSSCVLRVSVLVTEFMEGVINKNLHNGWTIWDAIIFHLFPYNEYLAKSKSLFQTILKWYYHRLMEMGSKQRHEKQSEGKISQRTLYETVVREICVNSNNCKFTPKCLFAMQSRA